MKWYYVLGGEQQGPVSEEEIQGLIARGTVTPMTLVWREGMANWQTWGEACGAAASPELAGGFGMGAASAGVGGRVCSLCGRTFSPDQVLQLGSAAVCAECKPAYLQRVREGGAVVPVAGSFQLASWGIRCAAKIIDVMIGYALGFVSQICMAAVLHLNPRDPGAQLANFSAAMGVGLVIGASYQMFFLGRFGATPGKMACKLRVVTPEGAPVTYLTGLGRYFAEIVSGMICGIGYFMPLWDLERRALHDRICNTRVIVDPAGPR
jgi:uncharacterized RDD family membrane protein YckC